MSSGRGRGRPSGAAAAEVCAFSRFFTLDVNFKLPPSLCLLVGAMAPSWGIHFHPTHDAFIWVQAAVVDGYAGCGNP